MVQRGTYLYIGDNSGAKLAKCLKVFNRNVANPGNIVVVSIKKVVVGKKVKKGMIYKAVVVKKKHVVKRSNGFVVCYGANAVVLLKKNDLIPVGTRVFGSVFFELRRLGFLRIISLAITVI